MSKRKSSTLEELKESETSALKRQKEGYFTPEKAIIERDAEAKPKASASRRETPGRAVKRKAEETRTIRILRRQGTPKTMTKRKSAGTLPEAKVPAEKSQTTSSKMILALKRIEMNVDETLHEHGVTLPDHDLTMLHSLRKSKESSEQPCIMKISIVDHKPEVPAVVPVVLRDKGYEILQTEPPAQALERPKNKIKPSNSQTITEKSILAAVTHVTLQSDIGESKNKFLENLALTQIVPTRAISNLSATKRNLRIASPKKYSSSPKKKIEPPEKKLPSMPNGKITTTNASVSTPNMDALKNLPKNQVTPENSRLVSKVKVIVLSPADLQKLKNNKSHIQYLATKKNPCPQEDTLLQKLKLNQKRILATGKLVSPVPGQRVQGIPFLSGACMYVVQHCSNQITSNTVQPLKKVVPPVPDAKLPRPATAENRSNSSVNRPQPSSVNRPQPKNSAMEKLLELATNNRCVNILPVAEKTGCTRNSCILQLALLKSELNQKSIALESCNSELANVKATLNKANVYISSLRAQLEENTQTLCSYLAESSHVNYE